MKISEFLTHLRGLGVEVKLQGERLILNAPKGVITPELRAELSDHKAEILAFLRQVDAVAVSSIPVHQTLRSQLPPITSLANQENIPASFAQKSLWFLDQLNPHSAFYNIPTALRLQGQLNHQALHESIQEIIRRHEALRTNFTTLDGEVVQVIATAMQIDLPVVDLQALPISEQTLETRRLINAEAAKPFNLTQEPLIRFLLLQLKATEQILVITMHHIISDGWSMGIFIKELTTLYRTATTEQPSPLPELTIQYPDFAVWQQQSLQGEILASQISYWQQQLANAPSLLELPYDRPRPARQTYQGATQSFTLPIKLSEAITLLSRKQNATVFMTLLAAFQTLLYRYTQSLDICIGSPVANRRREVEGLIGFFINTLVLRTNLAGEPSFEELLHRVKEVALAAYAHQDVPLEKLVEVLQPQRSLSYSPLFQVMFVLQNAGTTTWELADLTIEQLPVETSTAKFDLILSVQETNTGLVGNWQYNTDLFDHATIARMAGNLQILLAAIVANPEQKISQLPLLTPEEQHLVLGEWNNTKKDYPIDQSIHQLFAAQVERDPHAVAIVYEGKHLTYGELNSKANQLAHYLQTLGVKPEVLVGICLERSLEMIVGILGILKAGGAYVPLDPTYPPDRLEFMLADSAVPVLVTQSQLSSKLPPHHAHIVCLDTAGAEINSQSQLNPTSGVTADNLAYVIYTSGSTGKPKGVLINHQNVLRLFAATDEWFHFNTRDVWTMFHSYAFDFSVWEIWGALIYGGRLVVVPYLVSREPRAFYDLLGQEKVTVLNQTPSAFRQLIQAEELQGTNPDLQLRCVIFGGEALELQSLKPWFDRHGDALPQLVNMYGITETTVHVTYYPLKVADLEAKGSLIGWAIPDLQLYILDSHLQPVPIGVAGELHVGGSGLARGYLKRPELTAERFIPHPFSSGKLYKAGDLARYLPAGNIEYLGRIDNQVKIRGFRIELGEIEAVLANHPAVQEAVVIVREDIPGDQRLVAYLVFRPDQKSEISDVSISALSTSELRNYLREKLPDYMVPAAFVTLAAIPLTANGKIDRRALPIPQSLPVESNYLAPSNDVEEAIALIWAEVLQLAKVGVNDNFFDLGGHSLSAIRVITRLQEMGIFLSLRDLFATPTVAGLAQGMAANLDHTQRSSQPQRRLWQPQRRSSPSTIQPVNWENNLPLSFAQESLWFLDQLNPHSAFYNIPNALRLQGQLNHQALHQSIQEVIRRHAALRTNFTILDRETVQVITLSRELDLSVVDLQSLPSAEQAIETKRLINTEAAKPFNLTHEPLIRVLLLQLKPTEQILVVTMHHIVSDGWSMGIFVAELTTLYGAFAAGQPSPLPELTIQYPDFSLWQRQWLQGEILASQISYWQKQLANAPSLLELPYDRPRPARQTYRGATQSFPLSEEMSGAIALFSRKQNATVFMTLLAAFQTLLHRYTQNPDICIGSPVANRNKTETEGLIGFFVNTLVLRTNLADEPSFEELLSRVKEVALEAYAHQDIPLEKLVEILQPQRSLSYSPLFQVMFVLQNTGITNWELADLTIEQLPVETSTAKFDLILSVEETKTGLVGNWEYNTDLFDDSTITRMAGHFQTLLEGIITNPQGKITHLPLMPKSEQRLLETWNQTQTNYPSKATIHELFEAQVEQTPDAVALLFDRQQITYQELNQRANQLAHYLKTLGVKPEVTVGLCLERSITMIVATLAILKAGGVYVPLDPAYPPERLAFMFANAQVKILLTDAKLATQLPPHQAKVICLDTSNEAIDQFSPENLTNSPLVEREDSALRLRSVTTLRQDSITANNLAYIMYTSGSTGQPKGVCVTHRGVVRLVKENNYARLDSQGVFLQLAPIAFDAATLEIWGSLLNGAKLVIPPPHKLSLTELGQIIQTYQVNILWLTAGLFHLMVDERLGDLRPLQQLLAGGDILSVPQVQRFLQAHPDCQLINGYGPTENTTFTCCHPIKTATSEKSIPIGRPIANTQVYILDPQLQLVPIGVQGELYIGGDGLARGYLDRPDLTTERFIPNPFANNTQHPTSQNLTSQNLTSQNLTLEAKLYKTGDAVRYLPDGNIEFLGRLDNQVKIRGFRIELGEVESILAQHPQVQQTVVLAREDNLGDKYLVAYLTVNSEQLLVLSEVEASGNQGMGAEIYQVVIAEDLRQFLKQKLPDYMMPSSLIILPEFPLNAVGKVDRWALPNSTQTIQEQQKNLVVARDQIEEQLVEIWLQVLGKQKIGICDRFFEDLGGTSLKAARLFLRIEETFGKTLPLAILYEAPTVEELAKIIRDQEWSPSWLSLIPIQPQGTKIPLFCIHPGGGNVLCYRTLAPYLGVDQPVYGLQSRGLDGQEEAIDNIPTMASNYLQEIKAVQPQGPYILAGYSFGGAAAYEIAQQLKRSGEEVAAVIFFDAINPLILRQGGTPLLEKLKLHNANLQKLSLPEQWGYFHHRWDLKVRAVKAKLKALSCHIRGRANPEAIAPHLIQLEATNYQALLRYQPQSYQGKIVIFETIERPTNIYHSPSLGWSVFTDHQLEIINDIPGHHGTMLEEPYVAILGKKLKAYLEQFNIKL